MAGYATVAEAEVRIAELEKENNGLTRESKSYRLNEKKLKDFLTSKGFDIDKDFEEQWEEMEKKNGIVKTEAEKEKKDKEKMQKQLDEMSAKLALKDQESTENSIRSELKGKMGDVIGGDDLVDLWIAKKLVKYEDGKFYRIEDGKDVPLETAVAAFKKNNPDRIKMSQTSGGGSHPNTEQQEQKPEKIKYSNYKKLTESAKKDFHDKGGEVLQD
jgi:hypothetical protein